MFYEELKIQRESLGISLEQISNKTKINEKFLLAIEEGNFSVLPSTYIRLFLRAYAQEVELNPDDVIKSLEEFLSGKKEGEERDKEPERDLSYQRSLILESRAPHKKINIATIAIFVVVIFFIIAILKQILMENEADKVNPVPIGSSELPLNTVDSLSNQENITLENRSETQKKILTLAMQALDSCWIQIKRDNEQPVDYIFPPGISRTWIASEQFTISLGRPSKITLELNGQNLGPLGVDGVPTRIVITREGIVRRQRL